jgi:hypothetical protein
VPVEHDTGAAPSPAPTPVSESTLDELRAEVQHWQPADRAELVAYFDRNDTDTTDAGAVAEAMRAVRFFHDVAGDVTERDTKVTPAPPLSTPVDIDEGATLTPEEVAKVGKRYAKLPDVTRSWVSVCGAKVRLSPDHGGVASTRRLRLLEGLCALAEGDGFDTDDMVRACAAVTSLGDDAWRQGNKVADVVAAMTLADAEMFARVAPIVASGMVAMAWELDGRCVLSASVVDEVAA